MNGQSVVFEKVVEIDEPAPIKSHPPEVNENDNVNDILHALPEENILNDAINSEETELKTKIEELTSQLDKLKIENQFIKKKNGTT